MGEPRDKSVRSDENSLLYDVLFLLSATLLLFVGRGVFVSPISERLDTVRRQLSELRSKKGSLERETAELRRRIDAVRYDPFFIEAAARDVLKLVREGEIPLKTNGSGGSNPNGRNGRPSPPNE